MIDSIRNTIKLYNGVEMPRLGLGVWKVESQNELDTAIKAAFENGYWHIDTAQAYGNEDMVGNSIEKFGERKDIFLVTKLTNPEQANAHNAFEESLKKLKTDYVDLFLMHWPSPWRGTYVQAWKDMVEIYKSGRAKAIGVSNFKPNHMEAILDATGFVPMVNQLERHPLFQQDELAAYCREKGIVPEAYSPLGTGHLDEMAGKVEHLAKKYGKTAAQIIIRWHVQTDWVVIPKSVTPSRIAENSQVFDFNLDDEDMKFMASLDIGQRFLPDADEAKF